MEVTLAAHGGLTPPADTFVSLRIGQVQRHARFANTRVYRFPEEKLDPKACGRVEVFKRLGATTVCLGSSCGDVQDIEVPCNDPEFSKLRLRVGVLPCEGDQTPSKVQKKSATRVNSARRYLADHQLEDVLKEAMKEVMSQKPADPHDFLAQFILKHPSRRMNLPPLSPARINRQDEPLFFPPISASNNKPMLYQDSLEQSAPKSLPPPSTPTQRPRNLPPIQQKEAPMTYSKSTPVLSPLPAQQMQKSAPAKEPAPAKEAAPPQAAPPPVEVKPDVAAVEEPTSPTSPTWMQSPSVGTWCAPRLGATAAAAAPPPPAITETKTWMQSPSVGTWCAPRLVPSRAPPTATTETKASVLPFDGYYSSNFKGAPIMENIARARFAKAAKPQAAQPAAAKPSATLPFTPYYCENFKGGSMMQEMAQSRFGTPAPQAPKPAERVAEDIEVEAVTSVDFAFENLMYDKVVGSPEMAASLKSSVGEAVAGMVQAPATDIEVEISPGSVLVHSIIRNLDPSAAQAMKSKLDSQGGALLEQVGKNVSSIPGINDALSPGANGLGIGGLKIGVEQQQKRPVEAKGHTPNWQQYPSVVTWCAPRHTRHKPPPAAESQPAPEAEPEYRHWQLRPSIGTWCSQHHAPKVVESGPQYRHWQLKPSIGTWCCAAPVPLDALEDKEPEYPTFLHRPSVGTWCAKILQSSEPKVETKSRPQLIKRQSTVKFRTPAAAETLAMTTLLQGRLEEIEDLERQHAAALEDLQQGETEEIKDLIAVIESCLDAARSEYSALQSWGVKRGLSATSSATA